MIKQIVALMLMTSAITPLEAASDAASKFGAREDIQQISLSPDGSRIAFISPSGDDQSTVYVVPVTGGSPAAIARSSGDPDQFQSCSWSTDTRLVCSIYMILDSETRLSGFTRVITLDADGKNMKLLTKSDSNSAHDVVYDGGDVIDWQADAANRGSVLMTRRFVSDDSTGSHIGSTRDGYGVDRVDTTTLKRTTIEGPNPYAVEYIADGRGTVRIKGTQGEEGSGYRTGALHYFYRKLASREWEPLGDVQIDAGKVRGFDPVSVDTVRDVVYGFDAEAGRTALFSIALDGTKKRTLLLSRPDVDVDSLVRIGRERRVVGASYATEVRQVSFFDPQLKALAASLSRALPGLPLVSFVDSSADESKLLLHAGSDVDPGRYYLYDKTTRHLAEVLPSRSALATVKLGTVKPVTYPAADGTMIPGYLTLPPGSDGKNLPTIVMPHGGPGARDEWGFDWLSQFFVNRGFAVLQPNFRGSTGYGEAWFKDNGFRSWRTAVGDVNDGGRWLIKQGIAEPSKLAIFGWSYGGYAALQSSVLDTHLFKAIVAVAPVTDLESLRTEAKDSINFPLVDAFIGHGPEVREGSPARNAAAITAPVLLFHGDRDQNVGIGESRLMADRLRDVGKKVELVEFRHLDHYLDDNAARTTMLDKTDAFLRATMGMPAAK